MNHGLYSKELHVMEKVKWQKGKEKKVKRPKDEKKERLKDKQVKRHSEKKR